MSTDPGYSLTSLPGVRLWLDRLRADLRSGRSCLWLLPRAASRGPGCAAERLLDELLHEVNDFLLLPPGDNGRAVPVPAPASASARPPRWSGTVPTIDFDDGLSALDLSASAGPPQEPHRAPATVSDALTELLERLGKELSADPAPVSGDGTAAGWGGAEPRRPPYAVHGALARLAGRTGGGPETRPIVVRAWREAVPTAATHLLRRLVGTVREAGLPPAERPRSLVVAVAEDLPAGLPEQLAREDIAVHWWWGATGRLDTATVVALTRPFVGGSADRQLLEAVVQATVTEICGPFLDVAAALSRTWDGQPETLLDELRRAVTGTAPPADARPQRWDANHRPGRRPDDGLLATWSAAAVDSWDGRLRRHPAHDIADGHAVSTGMWLAHNNALLPLLDGAREKFTDTVRLRSRVPLQQLAVRYGPRVGDRTAYPASAGGPDEGLRAMELGAMWGAHLNKDIALTRTESNRLHVLWTVRNRLAHRQPLDGARLRHLATELCR
ncbi:hypothetical protein [Streptomyces sp.]|uniref:hypothetical protein n=1 Tax=Streptomyces sp. TaxID=1931 RepID=UPI002F3F4A12